MTLKKPITALYVNDLELNVNLGWRRVERKQEQSILLSLKIEFPNIPSACQTDDLKGTVCYAELIDSIREKIKTKHYRLIEHLSTEIYGIAKDSLPKKSKLSLRLVKFPKILGLTGGVCFYYGDNKTW